MPNGQTEYRKQLHRADVAELLPPLTYDRGSKLWLMSDKHIGFGWVSHPSAGVGEGTADKINTLLGQGFPPNSQLSISLWASPDIRPYINRMVEAREKVNFGSHPILESAIKDKARFFDAGTKRKLNEGMYTQLRDFLLVITVKIPYKGDGLPADGEWRAAVEIRTSIEKNLEGIGLAPAPLDAPTYLHVMSTILNWGETSSWKSGDNIYDETLPVNEQILDLDNFIEVSERKMRLGSKHVRVLSPKRYPDYVLLPMMQMIVGEPRYGRDGIPGNFLATMNIVFPDASAERDAQERKRAMVQYQAMGPFAALSSQIRQRKEDYDILFQGVEGGDKLIRMQHTFVLFANSDDEATMATAQMTSFYRDMQLRVQEDSNVMLPLFINALPFGADPNPDVVKFLRRHKTISTGVASELLPIIADWKGTAKPIISYVSRNGQPMGLDIYESSGNFNFLIVAASGSGKSFLANDLIVSYMSTGARVFVIDVGRSYEKICAVLDGEFMVFSPDSHLCLNPFQLVTSFEEEGGMLVDMIKSMVAPTSKLDDWQTAKLSRVITELFADHGQGTTIDMVEQRLLDDDDPRANDLGDQLFPYTAKGEYGRWFNGDNNVSFTRGLTCLELEELNSKPNLQTVVLLQLLYQITQTMYVSKPGETELRRTIILIDEAWALLGKGDVADFMITAYRRARKRNGSIGLITQSVSDLYANEKVGMPILENSQWLFLLSQKRESIEALKRTGRLALPDGGFDLLKTVHTAKGRYSEVFVYTSMGGAIAAGIGRLVVPRFSQLLYTTDAVELNAIRQHQATGLSLAEAIHKQIEVEAARAQ